MNEISSFKEVIYHLKEGEILFIIQQGKPTFFAVSKDQIRVYNENISYRTNFAVFEELFYKESFYLYKKSEENEISKEKDDEYYSWWHK